MGRLSVWFDEEGDFLEVSLDHEKGSFNDPGNGVFERVNEDGETIGSRRISGQFLRIQ